MNSLVSIIVPCYNQGSFLPYTLENVLQQTYQNWECIIVNDGSPDNTESIALDYCNKDARFKYLKKINGGLSSARNEGLKFSKGDFIQLLDADDLLEKDKINNQVKFLNKFTEVDIVYSGSKYFFNTNPSVFYNFGRNGLIPTINLDRTDIDQIYPLLWRNITTICSTLYRKSIFEIGNFNENFKSLEDWEFHFRCAVAGKKFHFYKSDHTNSLIRLHENSMLTNHVSTYENYKLLAQTFKNYLDNSNSTVYSTLGLPDGLSSNHIELHIPLYKRLYKRLLFK